MCILNHCSAQTEFFQTGFTDAVFPVYLTKKPDLSLFLFSFLLSISLLFSVPSAFSQENTDKNFQESFEEDPLTESDPDLGFEEDPLTESGPDLGLEEDPLAESGPDLGLEEDPLAETSPDLDLEEDPLAETSPDLGVEEDPLAESGSDLGMDEDPLAESGSDLDMDEDPFAEESSQIGQEETPNIDESEIQESEIQVAEQEEYQPKVTFSHEVKTLLGGTETKGLSVLEPLLSEIKELRFVSPMSSL